MSEPVALRSVLEGMADTLTIGDGGREAGGGDPVWSTDPAYLCVHVPARFVDVRLASTEMVGPAVSKAAAAVRMLVAGEAASLVLSGPVGCGKTHLAAAACHELAHPLWTAVFEAERALAAARPPSDAPDYWQRVNHSRVLGDVVKRAERRMERECPGWLSVPGTILRLQRDFDRDRGSRSGAAQLDEMADRSGLLVLDDLGAEKVSDWSLSVLFDIVDRRYTESRGVLVTTNKTVRQLAADGYGRIVSRLADGGVLLEMASAKDYRLSRRRLSA